MALRGGHLGIEVQGGVALADWKPGLRGVGKTGVGGVVPLKRGAGRVPEILMEPLVLLILYLSSILRPSDQRASIY